jgi:tetratricopeptide (TPR) repeat protein
MTRRSVISASGLTPPMVLFLLAVIALTGAPAIERAEADDAVTLGFETRSSYEPGPAGSHPGARSLALFRAKRKAVFLAADRFERQRLIQFVDRDKNELVHLVADALSPVVLSDQCRKSDGGSVCTVRVHTVVRLSDFIDAQLASLRLGTHEDEEDYRHEMEPSVPVPLNPGRALAKAYRLIDKKELRMAIIYLDRLADQYSDWWEIYDIKALALQLQDQPERMLEALRKACELGSPTACAELK